MFRSGPPSLIAGVMLVALVTSCWHTALAQGAPHSGVSPEAQTENDELRGLDERFKALVTAGNHAEAQVLARRFIAIVVRRDGEDSPNHATALDMLARVLNIQRRFAEAEPIYRRQLAIRERHSGPDHLLTAKELFSLGVMLYRAGRASEAEPLLRRTLAIKERFLQSDDAGLAEILNWLGYVIERSGRHQEAEQLYRQTLAIRDKRLGTAHNDTIDTLERLAPLLLHHRAIYADAANLYERLVGHFERAGPPATADLGRVVQSLGNARHRQSQYAEAERNYRRALDLRERLLGPNHLDTLSVAGDLGVVLEDQGRLEEAGALLIRTLGGRERVLGPDHSDVARIRMNLGLLRAREGRFEEAEKLVRRAVATCQKSPGDDDLDCATMRYNLGYILTDLARFAEAEALLKQSLATRERQLGPSHPDLAASFAMLAGLYADMGRYREAEALYRRSLSIREVTLGRKHAHYATSLNDLAILLKAIGRLEEAEALYHQALSIRSEIFGPDHVETATPLNNLALLYQRLGRHSEARPLLERSLAIREKALGRVHPDYALASNNLDVHHLIVGELEEAERHQRQALVTREKVFPPGHPLVAGDYQNLGLIAFQRGHFPEAERLFTKALELRQVTLGRDHPNVGKSLGMLGRALRRQERWEEAYLKLKETSAIFTRRALDVGADGRNESKLQDTEKLWIKDYIESTLAMAYLDQGRRSDYEAEAFEAVQWASQNDAATALRQMSARFATGNSQLAALVREKQDLEQIWSKTDRRLLSALSAARRDAALVDGLQTELQRIRQREAEIDDRLRKEFLTFTVLMSAQPSTLSQTQQWLGTDEVLVVIHTDSDYTYVFAVTHQGLAWHRAQIGEAALADRVHVLRCGLDAASWHGPSGIQCRDKLKGAYTLEEQSAGTFLPFDLGRAHELQQQLLAPLAGFLRGKSLLIVAPGPLAKFPFSVLVTQRPDVALPRDVGAYRQASWLGKEQPIVVLPSIASLSALRAFAKKSQAPEVFVGFGDPVLRGATGCVSVVVPESCPELVPAAMASPARGLAARQSASIAPVRSIVGGGLADVQALRDLCPLADTAHEIRCVARSVGAPVSSIRLGTMATETAVKRAQLDRFRVVHFATHGLLAGQVADFHGGVPEPALVLSPPETATEEDDGLLTVSEIAQLRLDADWIVLSACNTAAGGATNAESLAGLARAFFYAGARALLASHWEVYSDAAVKLVVKAFAELQADARIGRAEAMRRSMTAIIEQGGFSSHPAYWAPFVVVGEGTR